jgi:hypothetical protein
MDEIVLVQQAIKEVSEGKVSEEQAYRLIGRELSQREGIKVRRSIQEEERKGRSFWEEYKCEALKIFCKAIQEGSGLEQALHDVFVYFLGKFGPSVVMGLIYLILLKGAQAMCELLSKDCEEK